MKIPKFVQSVSIVTIGVMLGKIAGFFKHLLIVKIFGVTVEADSFFIVNNISEISVNILLSGIIAGAFIPIAGEVFVGNKKLFKSFVSSTFVIFGSFFFLLAIIFWFFALPISSFLASGYDSDQLMLIAKLVKIISPGLFFISLTAVSRGILHIEENFIIPSFGLFIYNFTVIVFTYFLHEKLDVLAPAYGISVGFFLWFVMQIPFLYKNLIFKFKFDENIKKLIKYSIPSVCILFFSNVIFIVEKSYASNYMQGTITELNIAFRTANVFSSILIIPLGTVLLPKLSKKYNHKDTRGFVLIIKKSIDLVSYIILAFLLFIIVNNEWLIKVLWSNSTEFSIFKVSSYLIIYSLSISVLFYYIILNRVYFAMQKLQYLVISNFIGFVVYLIMILFLSDIFNEFVFSIAFLGYSITVIFYLWLILNIKLYKNINIDTKNIILVIVYLILILGIYFLIKNYLLFYWMNFIYSLVAIVIFFIFQKLKIIELFKLDGINL